MSKGRIIRHVIEIQVSGNSKKIYGSTTGRIAREAAEHLVKLYEQNGHKVISAVSSQESMWRQFKNVHVLRAPLKVVRKKISNG